MKALLQRVKRACVRVDGEVVGQVDKGLLVLVGAVRGDVGSDADSLAQRTSQLRIFEDDQGKMNRSVLDVSGGVLVVSQFTLAGDCTRGRRPSFDQALEPVAARELVERYCHQLQQAGLMVAQGVFGADMDVELVNWGPVTFLLDSQDKRTR